MNIKTEYKDYLEKGSEYVKKYLIEQKEEINKKIYIINILNVLTILEENLTEIKKEVKHILIIKNVSFEDGSNIKFKLFNYSSQEISKYDANGYFKEQYGKIEKAFRFYFDADYTNPILEENKWIKVKTDENFLENMFEILLNDELKKSLHCAKLENNLKEKKHFGLNKKI